MSTEADIVTPEKLRALVTSDHKRGCQGREYGCSCGYDDDKDAMIERAAVALEKLRAERDAAARDMRERCKAVADADVRLCEQMQHDAETADIASRWAVCKQTAEKIGNAIAALPDAVIATEGGSHD